MPHFLRAPATTSSCVRRMSIKPTRQSAGAWQTAKTLRKRNSCGAICQHLGWA